MVVQLHSENDITTYILSNPGLIVIDAYATWCGPCRTLAPKLDMMAAKYGAVKIVKVDVDEVSSFVDKHNINAMPTILFIKGGQVVARVEGANAPLIESNIQKYM